MSEVAAAPGRRHDLGAVHGAPAGKLAPGHAHGRGGAGELDGRVAVEVGAANRGDVRAPSGVVRVPAPIIGQEIDNFYIFLW